MLGAMVCGAKDALRGSARLGTTVRQPCSLRSDCAGGFEVAGVSMGYHGMARSVT